MALSKDLPKSHFFHGRSNAWRGIIRIISIVHKFHCGRIWWCPKTINPIYMPNESEWSFPQPLQPWQRTNKMSWTNKALPFDPFKIFHVFIFEQLVTVNCQRWLWARDRGNIFRIYRYGTHHITHEERCVFKSCMGTLSQLWAAFPIDPCSHLQAGTGQGCRCASAGWSCCQRQDFRSPHSANKSPEFSGRVVMGPKRFINEVST